jgi:uncharacterized protein YbaP (TraB family)
MADAADPDVPQLTSKAGPKVILGLAAVAALAGVALIVWLVFFRYKTHTPTAAETHALADEACPKVTSSHFYTVVKDGKTSWLLGTRHAGVSLAKYPPAVADAFRSAKIAVFEALDDDPRETKPEPDVANTLGPDDWAKYRELVGEEMAERVRYRGIQTATAALALLYEDRTETIDMELEDMARSSQKQLVGLEDRARTDHLAETYVGAETLRIGLKQISRRELLANETKRNLANYCTKGERNPDASFARVTNDRTTSWVDKLLPLLEQGSVFVAVGVDHIDGGSLDLGALIEHHGFTVTRVP